MPALITQSRLRAQWVIGRAGGWKEEGCVWHVNSNQGSDIHQAPWPTVRINLGREDSQALFFVFASICRCLSRFSLRSLSLSSCLPPIHPFTSYLPLTPSIWLFVFVSRHCYIPLRVSPFLCVCHPAVINQHSHLVGGRGCEARSLMFTGRRGSEVTDGMTDGFCCMKTLTEIS